MEAAPHPWPALGVLLLRDGLVEKDELEEILDEQRDSKQQRVSGRRLGEILIQRGRVTPTQVAKLVAEQYELPFVDFDVADVDLRVASIMREDDARRFWALPINRGGDGSFLLAIADPSTVLFSDELRRLLGSIPRFAVVGPDAMERAISFVYSQPIPAISVAAEPSESADDLIVVPTDDASPQDEAEASHPHSVAPAHSWPPLGALLLRDELVTDEDLETALAQQRLAPSLRLGEILTGKGLVSRAVIARLVAEQYELPFYELERIEIDPDVARLLPEEIAWKRTAVPIAVHEDGSLDVAIADPTSAVYTGDLHDALNVPLTFVVASPDDIEAALDRLYEPTFDPPTEQADPVAESEPLVETTGEDGLEVGEPPHLVVEASAADVLDAPTEEDESSWTTRLELVEETVSDEVPEHVEHDVAELPWAPAAETAFQAEDEGVTPAAVEAEVFDLIRPDEPEAEDLYVEDAEVYEFSWPAEPEHAHVDLSLADDLAIQVAEAMVADVLEVSATEADEAAQAEEAVTYDVFGLASRPLVEPPTATAGAVVEHWVDEVETDESDMETETEPGPEPDVPVLAEVTIEDDVDIRASDFDLAVADAVAAGASAFHFSPRGDRLAVRARVDGLMRDLGTATPEERDALVDRLVSEGVARTHVVATSRGPKTTLFVRERAGVPTSLEELGLGSDSSTALRALLEHPTGAILVCGPAGSGTTTTLYALLEAFATPQRVVATVEHPVERLLDGVDQIEVAPSSGVTFAGALRDLRLTDTDAVLVGDLADRESAAGALSAAYEGRLVLAGFHARSAADAVRRLADMGVEASALASSLGCVVSQRLVRTVCVDCRETYYASEDELQALDQTASGSPRLLVRGTGCESCAGTGFRGRTAVFEVMPVTDDVRDLVADGASAKKLHKAAVTAGMRTLRDEGIRLCLDGVTTVAEVVRVLGDDA